MSRSHSMEPGDACLEVSEVRSTSGILSPELSAHAQTCPVCRGSASGSEAADAGALFDAVLADVQDERGPAAALRNLSTEQRLGVAGAAVVATCLVVSAVAPRWHQADIPVTRVVLVVTVLGALLAWTLRVGLRPLQAPPVPTRVALTGFLAGVFAPLFFALLPIAGPEVNAPPHLTNVGAAAYCFGTGAVVGIAAIVLLRALDRGAHGSRSATLLAAAAGGLLANTALEFHCAITDRAHLLLGHAGVALVLALVYGVLPRRGEF